MHGFKKVTVVDENDVIIGAEDYLEALEKGSIRRISRVFVFDEDGNVLLQKRSHNVRSPHLYDQAVGGHVDEGETYYEAAAREMEEELGLSGYPLMEIATSYRTDVFNGIYKAVIPKGIEIPFDRHEVEELLWLTPEELDERLASNPEAFTRFFPQLWSDLRAMLT